MSHYLSFTVKDFSREKSNFRVFNGPITALTIAGFLDEIDDLRTATDAMINGVIQKEMWVGDDTILSNADPTDETAERERKYLVTYEGDTSHKLFQVAIPTADPPAGSRVVGTDQLDLTNATVAAWVNAFEAIARTPDSDAETVTVLSIRIVGRNI